MNKIPIIQYLPLTRPKAVKLYVKKLNKSNVMTILDLEDSAQNIFDKVHKQMVGGAYMGRQLIMRVSTSL